MPRLSSTVRRNRRLSRRFGRHARVRDGVIITLRRCRRLGRALDDKRRPPKLPQAGAVAQDHEAQSWRELFLAKQALEKAQEIFNAVEQKYQEKKFSADTLRAEINRAKRDSDMAKGQIGILEPSLQSTFRR